MGGSKRMRKQGNKMQVNIELSKKKSKALLKQSNYVPQNVNFSNPNFPLFILNENETGSLIHRSYICFVI